MSTHANQSHQPSSRAEPQQKSASAPGKSIGEGKGTSAHQFADNRPKALAQQSLQRAVNNSAHVAQLKAVHGMANKEEKPRYQSAPKRPIQRYQQGASDAFQTGMEHASRMPFDALKTFQLAPLQLKETSIKHQSTTIKWHEKEAKVGASVDASLNPNQKVIGSAVDPNRKSYTPIDNLVASYNKGQWARGHLLNHDLGGEGVPDNLFPITSGANKRHANHVEYRVKDALAVADKNKKLDDWVHYKVVVRGDPSNAQFVCEWEYRDKAGKPKAPDDLAEPKGNVVIPSKLKGPKGVQPKGDPWGNSQEIKADHEVVWHHKDRKGAVPKNKHVEKKHDEKHEMEPVMDFGGGKSKDGYTLKDGTLSDAEIAKLEEQREKKKRDGLVGLFHGAGFTNIRAAVGTHVLDMYKALNWPDDSRPSWEGLKTKYEAMVEKKLKELEPIVLELIDTDDRIPEILGNKEQDYRAPFTNLVKETEAYKGALEQMKKEAVAKETALIESAKVAQGVDKPNMKAEAKEPERQMPPRGAKAKPKGDDDA